MIRNTIAKNFKHPPVLNIELLKWINSVKHIMNKYLKVLGGLYYGKELYIQLLTTSNPMRYFRAQSLCTEWVRGYRRVTNSRLSTPFQGQGWYNKPLQGMAPTECPLSVCLVAYLPACLLACLMFFWIMSCTHGHTDAHTTLPVLGILSEPKRSYFDLTSEV